MTTQTLTARNLLAGPGLLRRALALDAIVTGANGVAYMAAAAPLSDLLGIDAGALRAVGGFLMIFAAAVAVAAVAPEPRRAAAVGIVAANVLWVLDSLAVAATGYGSPTAGGTVWIALQALVVAGVAGLQLSGLRRSAAAGARWPRR